MKVIYSRSIASLPKTPQSCVAIGIFDGMHRGHRYLLGRMLRKAKALKAVPAVMTFFPHPAHVLRPDLKLGYLSSLDERLRMFKELGVRLCVVVAFDRRFALIEPQTFIRDGLAGRMGVKAVFVGEDFKFGRARSGDVALFKRLALPCGFHMEAVKPLTSAGEIISSTRIRRAVAAGQLTLAKRLLGRVFSLSGVVVKGRGRGRTLGFPTANVDYTADIVPPAGVYAVQLKIKSKLYRAVANLGFRPTFEDKKQRLQLEIHIPGFEGSLYGRSLNVEFMKRIRFERRFNSPQQLTRQIAADIKKALS